VAGLVGRRTAGALHIRGGADLPGQVVEVDAALALRRRVQDDGEQAQVVVSRVEPRSLDRKQLAARIRLAAVLELLPATLDATVLETVIVPLDDVQIGRLGEIFDAAIYQRYDVLDGPQA
jgi:transposase